MVYKRRYRPRKKGRRRMGRRNYLSKNKKFAVVKELNNAGFHQFKETFAQTIRFTTDAQGKAMWGAGTGFSQETLGIWTLNQILQSQEDAYKVLFSQYRMTGIRMKIFPGFNVASTDTIDTDGTSTFAENLPRLYLKTDYSSVTNPDDWASYLSTNPKVFRFNKPLTIWLKPRIQHPVTADTGSSLDVTNMRRVVSKLQKWCSSSTMDINHGGIKLGLSMGDVPSSNISFDAVTTFYFQMKQNL